MMRTFSGIITSFRLTHPLKQLRDTSLVPFGNATFSNALQLRNMAAGSKSARVRKPPLLSVIVASDRSSEVRTASVGFFAFSRLVMSWIIFRSLPFSGPQIFSSEMV